MDQDKAYLAVGDLGGNSAAGNLTVGDLGGNGATGDLAISGLASGSGRCGAAATATNNLNVDCVALSGGGLVVEVVEGAAQALVEDGVGANGERAVAADGPSSGVDGTSLRWAIELELPVGGNVTGAALGVLEGTVLEGHHEGGVIALPLFTCVSAMIVMIIGCSNVMVDQPSGDHASSSMSR